MSIGDNIKERFEEITRKINDIEKNNPKEKYFEKMLELKEEQLSLVSNMYNSIEVNHSNNDQFGLFKNSDFQDNEEVSIVQKKELVSMLYELYETLFGKIEEAMNQKQQNKEENQ